MRTKTIQSVMSLYQIEESLEHSANIRYTQPETSSANKYIYSIPHAIHLIWLGGSMPVEYLDNLRNLVLLSKNMDPQYVVNIWTDQGSRNASDDVLRKIDGLKIRNVESELLKPAFARDSTYTTKEKSIFLTWVLFEYLPPQNYAALSDLFRVEILRREGGLYLDTDVRPIAKEFSVNLQSLFTSVEINGGFSCLKNSRNTNNNIIIASNEAIISNILKKLIQSMLRSMSTEYLNLMPNYFANKKNYLIAKKSPVLVHAELNSLSKPQQDFLDTLTVNDMPAIRALTMAAGPYKLARLADEYLLDLNEAPGLREMEKMFDCYRNDNTWLDKASRTDEEKALIIRNVNEQVNFYLENIYNKDLALLFVSLQANFLDRFPTLNIKEMLSSKKPFCSTCG